MGLSENRDFMELFLGKLGFHITDLKEGGVARFSNILEINNQYSSKDPCTLVFGEHLPEKGDRDEMRGYAYRATQQINFFPAPQTLEDYLFCEHLPKPKVRIKFPDKERDSIIYNLAHRKEGVNSCVDHYDFIGLLKANQGMIHARAHVFGVYPELIGIDALNVGKILALYFYHREFSLGNEEVPRLSQIQRFFNGLHLSLEDIEVSHLMIDSDSAQYQDLTLEDAKELYVHAACYKLESARPMVFQIPLSPGFWGGYRDDSPSSKWVAVNRGLEENSENVLRRLLGNPAVIEKRFYKPRGSFLREEGNEIERAYTARLYCTQNKNRPIIDSKVRIDGT